jgi:mRNA interferase MazF
VNFTGLKSRPDKNRKSFGCTLLSVVSNIDEGLTHESCIRCDELTSLPKSVLTNFIGSLSQQKIEELNDALKFALELE